MPQSLLNFSENSLASMPYLVESEHFPGSNISHALSSSAHTDLANNQSHGITLLIAKCTLKQIAKTSAEATFLLSDNSFFYL